MFSISSRVASIPTTPIVLQREQSTDTTFHLISVHDQWLIKWNGYEAYQIYLLYVSVSFFSLHGAQRSIELPSFWTLPPIKCHINLFSHDLWKKTTTTTTTKDCAQPWSSKHKLHHYCFYLILLISAVVHKVQSPLLTMQDLCTI